MITSVRARLRFLALFSRSEQPGAVAMLVDRLHYAGLLLWVIALPLLLPVGVAMLFGNL